MSSSKSPIKGSTILVTGGTGSFGHEVVSKLLPLQPKQVVIFSRDELKQHLMRTHFHDKRLVFMLGDVRDRARVRSVFETTQIDYVFHAAALKQVPSCEFFPMEAVQTNVLGAANVLDESLSHGVRRVVVLSTDKSVYPINAMGMTKALMEKVMVARSRLLLASSNQHQSVCGVRYGNVLCTRGSVVPFFLEQMKSGKPLTVTDGSMTRFLLPLSEAVELVLYALEQGDNGSVYVRRSSAARMDVLAKAMCLLYDYTPGFVEIGVRPGEKTHETLISAEEMTRANEQKTYYQIPPETQDLAYDAYFEPHERESNPMAVSFTSENTDQLKPEQVAALLKHCIAEMKEVSQLRTTTSL